MGGRENKTRSRLTFLSPRLCWTLVLEPAPPKVPSTIVPMANAKIRMPGFTCSRWRITGTEKIREVIQVVRVSIEVSSGAARFHVAIRAESIQRAVSIVAAWYPGKDCRVKLPIEPEGFFVSDAAARTGIVGLERPDVIAA
jgi:hypothetical protein